MMVLNRIPKITSRLVCMQWKFISKCSKSDHYGMVLYHENPKTSKSIVLFPYKNETYQTNNFPCTVSSEWRIVRLFSNYVVFSINTAHSQYGVENHRINNEIPRIGIVDYLKWLAKTRDTDKGIVQPKTRIGRLDAANEAGFFHRTDRSRLKNIKKKLKTKDDNEIESTEPKKAD